MTKPNIISIQTGKPHTYSDDRGTWETAFRKQPVSGPVFVRKLGIEGDSQANTKHHGGPDKAVLLYSAAHYPHWASELGQEFPFGGFAENLTVHGMDETQVCIGDTYLMGEVLLQVSQGRVPCGKIPRWWGIPDLLRRVRETGRIGWYCRVLKEGEIKAGTTIELVAQPCQDWSIARAFQIYMHQEENITAAQELASCEGLSNEWLEGLLRLE